MSGRARPRRRGRFTARAVFSLASGLTACGGSGPAVVEIAAPPPSVAIPEDPPLGDDLVAGAGCMWGGEIAWARQGALPLCFAKEKACFAEAPSPFRGKVKLWLPPGEPATTGGTLDLAAGGIRLRAWTDADKVVLRPREPTVFGQIAIPTDAGKIRMDRVVDRALELSLRAEAGVSPRGGALRARVACPALGLDNSPYSDGVLRAVIGGGAALGERTLPAGKALSLSGSAAGPVVADVTPEDTDTHVELLEQSGGRSRIAWWRDGMVLFGWVDSSALGPPPGGLLGSGYGTGSGSGFGSTEKAFRCKRDVSLFAAVHETRERVGVIEKGTFFYRRAAAGDGAFVRVELRATAFRLMPGASWLVAAGALRGCE